MNWAYHWLTYIVEYPQLSPNMYSIKAAVGNFGVNLNNFLVFNLKKMS